MGRPARNRVARPERVDRGGASTGGRARAGRPGAPHQWRNDPHRGAGPGRGGGPLREALQVARRGARSRARVFGQAVRPDRRAWQVVRPNQRAWPSGRAGRVLNTFLGLAQARPVAPALCRSRSSLSYGSTRLGHGHPFHARPTHVGRQPTHVGRRPTHVSRPRSRRVGLAAPSRAGRPALVTGTHSMPAVKARWSRSPLSRGSTRLGHGYPFHARGQGALVSQPPLARVDPPWSRAPIPCPTDSRESPAVKARWSRSSLSRGCAPTPHGLPTDPPRVSEQGPEKG